MNTLLASHPMYRRFSSRRGIGGGIRPLPMKDLVAALEGIGLKDVRTYIQTGNVVFTSGKPAPQLAPRVQLGHEHYGRAF